MRIDRLLTWADYLENVVAKLPSELFDMGDWARQRRCGTTCCTLGYAASIPEFQAAGLGLKFDCVGYGSLRLAGLVHPDGSPKTSGLDVGTTFFEISDEQARNLFLPTRYEDAHNVTIAQVVARIRRLAAGESP